MKIAWNVIDTDFWNSPTSNIYEKDGVIVETNMLRYWTA